MFGTDREPPEDIEDVFDSRLDPDGVAAWAASYPMPDALYTPFGELDPAALSAQGRVDALVALERLRCWVDFQQQRLLAAMAADDASDPHGKDYASCEVACALKISADYAQVRLHTATQLTRFPATLDLLRQGEVSPLHARMLTEATVNLDDETAGKVEAAVLGRAVSQTPGLFRRSLNRALARLAPKQAEDAHGAAKAARNVKARPLPDAMGQLDAVITAEDIAAVMHVLNTEAHRLIAAGDQRTVPQLRADTLVDRILGRTPGSSSSGGAHIEVTLALSTLTGADDQPGELAGYGPIPASMARDIAARPDSVWHRLLTDAHGRLLDYGRSTYRPPAALADYVRAFDQRCTFPTCTRRAIDCDLDHLTAWYDGGETNPDNLAAECPRHHQMKHEHDWSVERLPDGTIQWTSPTGHTYERPLDPLPLDRTVELISTDPDPPPF